MLKKLAALSFVILCAGSAGATPFGSFYNNATSAALKPFALDLGGIIGGADFHSGRTLGFPGFDVGVSGTVQFKPDRDDTILRNGNVHQFGLPMIQAEIGLPLDFDVIARGTGYEGATLLGGGLRYGIHKSGVLSILPDVAVSFFGDRIHQTYFSATHYSADAVASFGLPILKPYVGAGFDYTKVTVDASAATGLPGTSATARGTRFTGGVDLSPLPLFHLYGAYVLLHGISGLEAGMGLRF